MKKIGKSVMLTDENIIVGGGGLPLAPIYPKLGAWNRLEGRPRTKDFDQVLSVEIHDALWMLTRQWQFGEFKGENAATAVKASVKCNIAPMTRLAPYSPTSDSEVNAFTNDVPIEALVECETIQFNLKTHLQVTKYWKQLLNEKDLSSSVFQFFLNQFSLKKPTFTEDQIQDKAHFFSNPKAVAIYNLATNKIMNGEEFYQMIKNYPNVLDFINSTNEQVASEVTSSISSINDAMAKFKLWFQELYIQPQGEKSFWNPNKLEYQFSQAVNQNSNAIPFVAEEYYHGHLDWYSFDVNKTDTDFPYLNKDGVAFQESNSYIKNLSLLPTDAQFAGMPSNRWWELEDGMVNFGNIDASTTDVAKILLAEFGLLYSQDWQVIPLKVPIGHYSNIEKIIVTDVFGKRTKVESANLDDEPDWNFFQVSNQLKDNSGIPEGGLLIPSSLLHVQESKPIELVRFQRDEMANMVWAIESIIPNELGKGQNGYEAFLFRQKYMGLSDPKSSQGNATFTYEFISDSIPDNWIPFIPNKIKTDYREIKLIRGAIEKRLKPNSLDKTPIQPFGIILNEVATPYFINEEEIPRSGIQVSRTYQRTRWTNGKVYTWIGRRKKAGRGETSSGLKYDNIK
ncbi:MAG: hypothetical protein AB8H03_16780 [Saprospiraceae bacterium]